jgi:hypothetical protein
VPAMPTTISATTPIHCNIDASKAKAHSRAG